MKIKVSEIEESRLHLQTSKKPEWLTNISEVATDAGEWDVSSDIYFDLRFTKILREINVSGSIEFVVTCPCDRCLDSVDLRLRPDVNLVLSPGSVSQDDEEGDIDYETYSGDEIDLSDYLRQLIAMSLPIKVLCQESCRGLCNECGANLNKEQCGCEQEWIDPRLSVLKELKV